MIVHAFQPAATGALRPATAARPSPAPGSSPDRVEVSSSQQAHKLAWSVGGAVAGAVAGMVAVSFVTPMLAPLVGLGVGALITAGPVKIHGKPLREWLSPFKAKETDAPEAQKAAHRKNLYVRVAAGVVGGIVAAHFAAPALMLTTVGAGLVAGWKWGSRHSE